MDHLRYLEGYAVVVHSRAEAYPLQGWFERHQQPPSGTPLASRGPAAPGPPVAPGVGYPVRQRSGGLDEGRGSCVVGTSRVLNSVWLMVAYYVMLWHIVAYSGI